MSGAVYGMMYGHTCASRWSACSAIASDATQFSSSTPVPTLCSAKLSRLSGQWYIAVNARSIAITAVIAITMPIAITCTAELSAKDGSAGIVAMWRIGLFRDTHLYRVAVGKVPEGERLAQGRGLACDP